MLSLQRDPWCDHNPKYFFRFHALSETKQYNCNDRQQCIIRGQHYNHHHHLHHHHPRHHHNYPHDLSWKSWSTADDVYLQVLPYLLSSTTTPIPEDPGRRQMREESWLQSLRWWWWWWWCSYTFDHLTIGDPWSGCSIISNCTFFQEYGGQCVRRKKPLGWKLFLELPFLRFSTCEDFIKENKYGIFPNTENSFKINVFIFGFTKRGRRIWTGPFLQNHSSWFYCT